MLTAEKRADAEEDARVYRSPLAASYPCHKCCGDGYLEEYHGDVVIEHDCPECHGSGADEFAEYRDLVERSVLARRANLNLMASMQRTRNRDEAISKALIGQLKDLLARSIGGEDVQVELAKVIGGTRIVPSAAAAVTDRQR